MEAKAILRSIRIAPRKVQLVAELIRQQKIAIALNILNNTNKRACEPIKKLLNSAVANAVNNHGLDGDNLIIKEVLIGDGPTLKRFRPRAHGRAYEILKRTSHITITVSDEMATRR